jgi:Na+-driven multidrug efflux pump
MPIVSLLSTLVHVVMGLVILSVVLGTVKRLRPDVYMTALIYASVSLGGGVLLAVVRLLSSALLSHSDVSSYMLFQITLAGLSMVLSVACTVLLARTLVQLATPVPALFGSAGYSESDRYRQMNGM